MAVNIYAYNDGKMGILNGWIDLAGDIIKVALCTSSYTPDIDVHDNFDDITNELGASGNYTAGGATLGSKTAAADDTNDRGVFDAADLTWTALTPSAAFRYGIIYRSTGTPSTSRLIAYIDFGADQNPGGSNFTIAWHADGILYI
ncbi:MAG: hypothetical protein FVQ79_02185 [Planctomycetes bacterium]|nr:hypothetical protein [Planctomycetota bacterium]